MPGLFVCVRPYSSRIHRRVVEFLEGLDYRGARTAADEDLSLSTGSSDVEAANWIAEQRFDLLVLSFHLHRDAIGTPVDGVGVALQLSETLAERAVPILMPVSRYSYSAGFFGRLSHLERQRPEVARLVVPMCESEIGAPEIAEHIKNVRGYSRAPGSPSALPASQPPATVRHGLGFTGLPPSAGVPGFSLMPPRVTLGPPSSARDEGAEPYESGAFRIGSRARLQKLKKLKKSSGE